MGITHMFEWQAECLRTGNVLQGGIVNNLSGVSLPTTKLSQRLSTSMNARAWASDLGREIKGS